MRSTVNTPELRIGDVIEHPIEKYGKGRIVAIHKTEPLPGRPNGMITGWMKCAGCHIQTIHTHFFSLPIESTKKAAKDE